DRRRRTRAAGRAGRCPARAGAALRVRRGAGGEAIPRRRRAGEPGGAHARRRMRIALVGSRGKVGRALAPALEAAGHEVRGFNLGDALELRGLDAAVDFTAPDAVEGNVRSALEQGVPCVVGTTGWDSG